MKRVLFALVFVALVSSAVAADEFVYPPEQNWPFAGDPWYNPWVYAFPYQRNIMWDFDDPSNPLLPTYEGFDDNDLKDSDFIQLGGADLHTFENDPTGTTTRVGFLGIDNRQGSVMAEGNVTFHIDNWEVVNPCKHVWIEIEFLISSESCAALEPTSVGLPEGFDIVAADVWLFGPEADNGYLIVIPLKIEPNPPWEELTLTLQADPGHYVLIDHVHFATECVPEPVTATLLAVGAGALAVFRRRRRGRGDGEQEAKR